MKEKRRFIALSGVTPTSDELKIVDYTISKEIYEEYKALCHRLTDFENAEYKFFILEINTEALEKLVKEMTSVKTENVTDEQREIERIWANSFAITFFTTFVLYDKHTERRLKNSYGKDSMPYKTYMEVRENEYDNNFEYRFATKMRNYLHCDLPFNYLIASAHFDHPTNDYFQNKIGFDPKILLNNGFDWKSMDSEIRTLKNYIPASGLFNRAFESLKRLHDAVAEQETSILKNDGLRIKEIIKKVLDKNLLHPGVGIYTDYTEEYTAQNPPVTNSAKIIHAPIKVMKRLKIL